MNHAHASFASDSVSLPRDLPGASRARAAGVSMPMVLAMSVGAHLGIATVLAALPAVGRLAGVPEELLVAVDFFEVATPPEPLVEPVPPPEPPPVAAIPREPRVRVEPLPELEPVAEPPAPVAAAVPPSVDDVFGDPPPPAESLTAAAGAGSFAVPEGEPGGVPGGRAGGRPGGSLGGGGLAATASASAEPDGLERRRARDAYKRLLERFLRERMSYPRAAAREHIEGRVELALRIGSDGALLGVRVASSSGHDLLDREAMATARDAGRMPAPPEPCALAASDELRVGVVYRLR